MLFSFWRTPFVPCFFGPFVFSPRARPTAIPILCVVREDDIIRDAVEGDLNDHSVGGSPPRTLVSGRISMAPSRGLSGPRLLRQGVDIVSKPRIRDHGASTVLLETQPTFQTTGVGRAATPPHADVTSTLVSPVPYNAGVFIYRAINLGQGTLLR